MSVVVTVAAVGYVAIHSGALLAIAGSVAATLGLRAVEQGLQQKEQEDERLAAFYKSVAGELKAKAEEVELSSASKAALESVVAERCQAEFHGQGIRLTLTRDIRGILKVRAHGEGLSQAELQERARTFLGLIQQQIAYREVLRNLKQRGFAVEHEERLQDGTARIRVVKGG